MILRGNIVDIFKRRIFQGEVTISDGIIQNIEEKECTERKYILPGFVDAHIHIESSMLVPSEFAKVAVTHGTVATVSDPHEIANVLGIEGVEFMINNGKQTPFKFNFGAPSCVPATTFESAGSTIDAEGIKYLMANPDIRYLAEMMNYPGVLFDDDEVMKKMAWAKHYNKPIDGHAPGLRGEDLSKYITAGISTDHECFTYDEALEKLQKGMKVIIREGSAAKNFNALIELLHEYYENIMFCSDDKHPDDLLLGHIDELCRRAIAKGLDVFKVLLVACVNPVIHYKLDVGLLRIGDKADCIVVDDLIEFKVKQTFINGNCVYDEGVNKIKTTPFEILNNFNALPKKVEDFRYESSTNSIRVIECLDGQLITKEHIAPATFKDNNLVSNIESDILKVALVNRYQDVNPAIGFIKNFNLKEGAIASSVGHDSHNIIAVGVSDQAICHAVNLIIEHKGGICAVSNSKSELLPLPVAGIMSALNAETVGMTYAKVDAMAKEMGSTLTAPFMSLSFMALLVIPSLKLSDKGLFDGDSFTFKSLEVTNARN